MLDKLLRAVGLCRDSRREEELFWRISSDERREQIEKARHEDLERMGRLELECRHLQSRWKTQGFCFFNKRILASAGLVALFFSRARELGYHEPSMKEFCKFLEAIESSCNGRAFYIPCFSRDLSIYDNNQQIRNITVSKVLIQSQKLSDGAMFFCSEQEQHMLRGSLNIEIVDLAIGLEVNPLLNLVAP